VKRELPEGGNIEIGLSEEPKRRNIRKRGRGNGTRDESFQPKKEKT